MNTPKILLVDDDPLVLDLLATYVEAFGFSPTTAEDGVIATAKMDETSYPIVITDMMMPNMDGMQLLKYIRENHPRTSVIVVTGYDRTFTYTDVIRAGATDFITKPFSADELEAKLKRAVRELEMVSQLEILSISDGLTQIFNRRHFDIKIWEEVHRADRQGHDVFLLLLDVDNFKRYNDQLGHQAGDRLLQSIGAIMKSCIRENVDWAFRFGGDEFSILLTQITMEQALMTGRRILQKFAEQNFLESGLSIGMARFVRHQNNPWETDIADLIGRADKTLYTAKNLGKNQICVDEKLLTQ